MARKVKKITKIVMKKEIDLAWLKTKLNSDNVSIPVVANELNISRNTIYKMARGEFSEMNLGKIQAVYEHLRSSK